MIDSLFFHVRFEFFSEKWGTVVTLENLGNSMIRSNFRMVPFPAVELTISTSGNRE